MREMNDYTAEVIRRASDKKQRRRSDLTRALGASCAVVVCAFALLGVLGKLRPSTDGINSEAALPTYAASGDGSPDGYIPNDLAGGEDTDGVSAGFVHAEIELPGSARFTLFSPEEAEAIAEAVSDAKAASALVKHAGEGISPAMENDAHIRLTSGDGRTEEYLVIGNMLYRVGGGDGWLMPDEALAELMSKLDETD